MGCLFSMADYYPDFTAFLLKIDLSHMQLVWSYTRNNGNGNGNNGNKGNEGNGLCCTRMHGPASSHLHSYIATSYQ